MPQATVGPAQNQAGFGSPISYGAINGGNPITVGMQTTDYSYYATFAATGTTIATIIGSVAASGQLWELGTLVQGNNGAAATITGVLVVGWTNSGTACSATVTVGVIAQATNYYMIAPDAATAITMTTKVTVFGGPASANEAVRFLCAC